MRRIAAEKVCSLTQKLRPNMASTIAIPPTGTYKFDVHFSGTSWDRVAGNKLIGVHLPRDVSKVLHCI